MNVTEPEIILMKQHEIYPLKVKIWSENNSQCPVLKKNVHIDSMVLDHKHKRKTDEIVVDDNGLIRTALELRVNVFFGKIENSFKRYGLHKDIDLPTLLRNGADYLEKGAYASDGRIYVHPNEVPKKPKLRKTSYNTLKKAVDNFIKDNPKSKLKIPEYNGKFTKPLEKLFEKFSIIPEFML